MVPPRVSIRLKLFWEMPSFGVVWEIAFRRYNTSKDTEVSPKKVRARQSPKEWVSAPTLAPLLRKGDRQAAPLVSALCEESNAEGE